MNPISPSDQTAASDPSRGSSELLSEFLTAVACARKERARELLPQVDWKAMSVVDSPVKALLGDRSLWLARSAPDFLTFNRDRVAEAAFENFQCHPFVVEETGGWESQVTRGPAVFSRAVYLLVGEMEDGQQDAELRDSIRATLTVEFPAGSCRIGSVSMSDFAGNEIGSLPGWEELHERYAAGTPYQQMPAFLLEVMSWCVERGRPDLVVARDPNVRMGMSPSAQVLWRCAQLGQVEAVSLLMECGADPHEVVRRRADGSRVTVVEEIENEPDAQPVLGVIRSWLARRAALHALEGASAATTPKTWASARARG